MNAGSFQLVVGACVWMGHENPAGEGNFRLAGNIVKMNSTRGFPRVREFPTLLLQEK